MNNHFDIVVVGAGIAGSALACALATDQRPELRGLRIAMVEARELRSGWPPVRGGVDSFDLRVSALTAASCGLLEKMGVWQAVASRRVCPMKAMQVWDGSGTGQIGFDASEVAARQFGYIVENRLLVAALLNHIRDNFDCGSRGKAPGGLQGKTQVDIIDGSSVVALHSCDTGGEPGSIGRVVELCCGRRLHCELVVAADGATSPLREFMDMPVRDWDYGQDAIVCTVEVERPHHRVALQNFTVDGPLAYLPLASQQESVLSAEGESIADDHSRYCSIVWSQRRARAEELMSLDDEAFAAALSAALEYRLGSIKALSARQCFPLRQRHAKTYVQSGFTLIADAAHTIHPLAGQGINLGLADVRALVETIANARARKHSCGELQTLQRYQRQRKTDNLAMMAVVEGFKHLFQPLPLPAMLARNWSMNAVDRQSWLKEKIVKYAMGVD